jgi:hypothetical protein
MITNSELRSLLQQDGIKLGDVELAEVKSLLIQLATIEYQSHVDKKYELNAAGTNKILHISRDSDLDTTLQLAA